MAQREISELPGVVLEDPTDTADVAAVEEDGSESVTPLDPNSEYVQNLPDESIVKLAQNKYISPQTAQQILESRTQTNPITAAAMSMFPGGGMDMRQPNQKLQDFLNQDNKAQQAAEVVEEEKAAAVIEEGIADAQEEAAARQAAKQVKVADQVEQQVASEDEKVATDQEPKKENWGKLIGQSIAIMMGALSQGLTGSRTNPGVEAVDKAIEREAAARKYDESQKAALRKQMLDEAKYRLDIEKANTDSIYKRAQIAKIQADLQKSLGEVSATQEIRARIKAGKGFSAEEVAGMEPAMSNRMVQVAPNMFLPTASKNPTKLKEALNTFDNATRDAKELRELTREFGNNTFRKIVDREAIGRSEALLQGLVGALRLPYFGPGVLTDTEQALARSMIGNPSKVFSLASANEARINTIIKKLNYGRRAALRNEGVALPMSRNEKMLALYRSKGFKGSNADLINALIDKGQWEDEEQ